MLRLGLSHPCTAFDKWRADPGRRRRRTPTTPSSSTSSGPTSEDVAVSRDRADPRRHRRRRHRSAAATAPTCSSTAGGSPRSAREPRTAPGRRRVIDADGLVLAPGFIDMHAHSDLQILAEPRPHRQGQPGRHHRGARPGRPVATRRSTTTSLAALRETDRRLERRPGGLRLRLAHRRRSTSTASTGASPATRPTWSRRAPCGCWSVGAERPAGDAEPRWTRCRAMLRRRAASRARSA